VEEGREKRRNRDVKGRSAGMKRMRLHEREDWLEKVRSGGIWVRVKEFIGKVGVAGSKWEWAG
jgi:hypothetical protein